jgi:hypothetical protein
MAYILTQRKGTHTKKYQKKRGTKGLGEGLNKLKRKTKEKSRMDNPETRNIDNRLYKEIKGKNINEYDL